MNDLLAGGGIVGLLLILFLILVAILWLLLPFAVFGIKDRLDSIVSQAKKTNKLLELLLARMPESRRTNGGSP